MPQITGLAIGENRINLISKEEVNEKIGDLTTLKTTTQNNTVEAINSLYDTRVEANPVGIMIINYLYPIGSLYFSLDASFNPNTTWQGTNWELISAGKCIRATQTEANVGKEVAAGLPELTGTQGHNTTHSASNSQSTGVFKSSTWITASNAVSGSGGGFKNLVFKASDGNPIYGRSNTVTPESIDAFIWKRIV